MATAGKNSRRQFEVEDTVHNTVLSVDSQEEIDMVNFLCEAYGLSVVSDFLYQPEPFLLTPDYTYTNVDGKERCLFRKHIYTPDFCLVFDPDARKDLAREFKIRRDQLSSDNISVYIDVKGTFNQHDGGRAFSLNQKWVWSKFGIYVYKLIPKLFFAKFGVPLKSFYSKKTKKSRKMFAGMKSMKQAFGLK